MKPYSPQYGLSLGRVFQQFGELGKDYIPSPNAPNTFEELMQEWHACCTAGLLSGTRVPFRVYAGDSGTSIYGTPEANYAFRYMHDIVHVQLGLEFDVADEIATAKAQLRMLGPLTKEEIRTFLIDTAGQALYHVMTGEFVEDQAAFVQSVYEDMRIIQECYPHDQENEIQILTRAVRLYVNAFCYPNATRNQ